VTTRRSIRGTGPITPVVLWLVSATIVAGIGAGCSSDVGRDDARADVTDAGEFVDDADRGDGIGAADTSNDADAVGQSDTTVEPDTGHDALRLDVESDPGEVLVPCHRGATRCGPYGLEMCRDAQWVGVGCPDGESCVEEGGTGACLALVCSVGDTRCGSESTVETCNEEGTAWVASACMDDETCRAGVCETPTCEPGASTCLDFETVSICDEDGTRWLDKGCYRRPQCARHVAPLGCTCIDDRCEPRICGPGTVACAPDGERWQRAVCNAAGTAWVMVESLHCAPHLACVDSSRCTTPACDVGELRCNVHNGNLERCADNGREFELATVCADSDSWCFEGADGPACEPRVCEPRTVRCVDGESGREQCARDGLGWDEILACTHGCAEGRCIAEVCVEGARCGTSLVGPFVERCADDGISMESERCLGWGEVCDPVLEACAVPECDVDTPASCEGGERVRCDLNAAGYGYGYTRETCRLGCTDGECNAEWARCFDDEDCGDARCSGAGTRERVDGIWVPGGRCIEDDKAWVPATWLELDEWVGVGDDIVLITAAAPDEVPEVRVTVTRPWVVDRTETTVATWVDAFGAAPPSAPHAAVCPECPVGTVTPWAAMAWANLRSERDGLEPCYALAECDGTAGAGDLICGSTALADGLASLTECTGWRLPTEVEWELAAVDVDGAWTPVGNVSTSPCDLPRTVPMAGWLCWTAGGVTHPVATDATDTNDLGMYDMTGNVSEWVHTSAVGGPSEFAEATDPILPFGDDVDTAWLGVRGWNYAGLWTGIEAWRRQVLDGTVPLAHPAIGVRLVRTFEP